MRTHEMELTDAGKRVSDQYNLHRIADVHDSIGRWFAVRLSDGTGDGVLYDSKTDAVRHQKHNESFYAFVQVTPAQLTPRDASGLLALQRRMYDSGMRLADPAHRNGGRDLIKRSTDEDMYNQLRSMFKGDRPPSNIVIPGLGSF